MNNPTQRRRVHRVLFFSVPLCLCVLFLCCWNYVTTPPQEDFDRLNDFCYAYHYRSIDTVAYNSKLLVGMFCPYNAEQLNNQAFVHIARMDYDEAEYILHRIARDCDNQIELLVCHVQQMRLCQRRSRNREFYEFREQADRALARINEDRSMLSERQKRRLLYAETEYAIVNATYYYYVGLEQKARQAIRKIDPQTVQRDTAQYLNYLYFIGSGGIITEGTQQEINQQEFDYLLHCFLLARQGNYPYFAANALEALSEHLMDEDYRRQLIDDNLPAMKFINPDGIDEDMLPGWLAETALDIFSAYGDVYQIAGAYRTLASCYRQIGDYESALFNLEQALSDSVIYQAPDLVASIREQLSVAYAAIDDKPQSDYNRNLYLDLQETTRQDRQLEARASQYEKTAKQLNWMLGGVVGAIVLLLFSLWLFNYLNKKQAKPEDNDDLMEQRGEELAALMLRVENSERRHLEQRAKVSLVNTITPFIDRIIHETRKPDGGNIDYVRELTEKISEYNDVLTHWIQLRQGELSLKIESFPLQPLFDLIAKGRKSFQMKGVELQVKPTDAVVKADNALTLFMLNTLADNARKFTPRGGQVVLKATPTDQYVEIAVEDTGDGMTAEQLEHLFDAKPIHDESQSAKFKVQGSHGFGLLNCKGIIEKYRKTSQIFSVCDISATSTLGKGSRLFFRLPKGVVRGLFIVAIVAKAPLAALAQEPLARASAYADSAYFSNINGTYERTLQFADSCRYYLNQHYRALSPGGRHLMLPLGNPSLTAPEIKWYHDSLATDYHVILDIRNESAVAALALHEWQLYAYNNRIYTQLFKEMSADNSLGEYCRVMQQSQTNKTIAVILLVLILLAIVPAYYLLYYRHRLYARFLKEQQRQTDLELIEDELRRAELEDNNLHVSNAVLDNCLSSLKHETMYYPSRITQLLDADDVASLSEVTDYYRELYGILSQQATREAEHTKLHLKPLEHQVLGDENLIRYLFEILRKQSGQKKLERTYTQKGDQYIEVRISMPQLKLSEEQARDLFTPSNDHIPYLICRQIVRDHGEATNRRGCGIYAERDEAGQVVIVITLPAAKVKSST